jgi:prephenate dehydratase
MKNTLKIGVSGNQGSFSEEAANYYCQKEEIEDYSLDYLISVENVLTALEQGNIDKAVFPIENSNGGIVIEAVYAMSQHNFIIEKIFEIDVRHCLHIIPGTDKEKITKVVSHPQALKQCRMYLKRKWPHLELQEYSDTASAAKDLAAGVLEQTCAVIAPKICTSLYGLELLEEGIQDLKFNFTTFITAVKR